MLNISRELIALSACCLALALTSPISSIAAPESSAKNKNISTTGNKTASVKAGLQKTQSFADQLGVPYKEWEQAIAIHNYPEVKRQFARLSSRLSPETRHYWAGLLIRYEGRYEEALAEFEQCGDLDRFSDEAIYQIADTYAQEENHAKTIALSERLVTHNSKRVGLYELRANSHLALKQYEQACSDYLKHASMVRKGAKTYIAKASECKRYLGKNEEAEKILSQALADTSEPNQSYMFIARARLYSSMKKWPEAVNDFTNAIQLSMKGSKSKDLQDVVLINAYKERAKCYDQLGKKDLAAKDRNTYERLSRNIELDIMGRN